MQNKPFSAPHLAATDRLIRRPWWQRRQALMAGAGTVIAVAVIALAWSLPSSGTITLPATSLDTASVTRAPFQDYLPVRAEVVPLDNSFIAAEAVGRVDQVMASDGEMVSKGQVLAQLANPDLTLQVSLQDVDLSTNQSQINQQIIELKKAEEQRDRDIADTAYALHKAQQELGKKQFLRDANLINDLAVKSYQDEVDYQQGRLESLKAAQAREAPLNQRQMRQIEKSAADLARTASKIKEGLRALLIMAPQSGRLSGFDLKPGQAVKVGDALGEVDSENSYKVKAPVDEYYVSRLKADLKGTAQLHGQTVILRINKIFPQVTDGRIAVEFLFDGVVPAGLKRGEAVDVKLMLGDTKDAVLVPVGAWLNESGGATIFVLNDKGDGADRRDIVIGRRNPDFAEITSGLTPGERVVTGGVHSPQSLHVKITQGSRS